MDEMKYLVFGDDFVTTNGITVHQPTISEIHEFGAMSYLSLVNLIVMRPYDDMVNLWKQGIDYEEITDYDLFMRNMKYLEPKVSGLFFGDLDFRELCIKINPQNGETVLTNGDIIIDRGIHAQIAGFIRFIHFIPSDDPTEIKPANLGVKKYLIQRMEKSKNTMQKNLPNRIYPILFPRLLMFRIFRIVTRQLEICISGSFIPVFTEYSNATIQITSNRESTEELSEGKTLIVTLWNGLEQ